MAARVGLALLVAALLAVAYDAAGRRDDARRTGQRALALAESQGNRALANEIRTRPFLVAETGGARELD